MVNLAPLLHSVVMGTQWTNQNLFRPHPRTFEVLAALPLAADHNAVRRIFSYFTWELRVARTYPEAVAALSDPTLNVILTDESFPGGESWKDLLATMHTLGARPPVVVFTDSFRDDLFEQVLRFGGFGLLHKPIRRAELVDTTVRALLFGTHQLAFDAPSTGLPATSPT